MSNEPAALAARTYRVIPTPAWIWDLRLTPIQFVTLLYYCHNDGMKAVGCRDLDASICQVVGISRTSLKEARSHLVARGLLSTRKTRDAGNITYVVTP